MNGDSLKRRDAWFMELAALTALRSKDRSTKVGAVIVSPDKGVQVLGYNGFPRNIADDRNARHERPVKYEWTEHAERNAIYNAARNGFPTRACTMYSTLCPCVDCARAIIQAGILRIVCPAPDFNHPTFGQSFVTATEMLREARVQLDPYVRQEVPQTGNDPA